MTGSAQLITARLRLRCWTDADRDDFAELNADPEVMHDLGGPISRADSDRKLDDFALGFERHGYSRWLIETIGQAESDGDEPDGGFIGYAGVVARTDAHHPLGTHDEIGWRLIRSAWGNGYATEAARAALADVFARVGLREVVSYTAPDNYRSRAVMTRLDLVRHESRDFTTRYPDVGIWTGLVWAATAPPATSPPATSHRGTREELAATERKLLTRWTTGVRVLLTERRRSRRLRSRRRWPRHAHPRR